MNSGRMKAKVIKQEKLTPDICSLWLSVGDIALEARPGQFIMVFCKDTQKVLGRPISICEIDRKERAIRIVYRIAGHGTREFSELVEHEEVQVNAPLGNGYLLRQEKAILVAGGIGIPPMLELAKQLQCEKTIVLGYRDNKLFLCDDLQKYGKVVIATEDGSIGFKGNVMDAIKGSGVSGDIIYSCGPKPMLKALQEFADANHLETQLSLEEKMACGMGICLGCAVPIKTEGGYEYKKVCHDGPVFDGKEVVFDA